MGRRPSSIGWIPQLGFAGRPTCCGTHRTASIFNSVQELEAAIHAQHTAGFTPRLCASFCWPWSEADQTGHLVNNVVIGEWARPWNAKPESARLAPGMPRSHYWASSDPHGLEQVGCVYTAQGFEFDYVGVIFGRDLRYDLQAGVWIGDKTQSHNAVVKLAGERFVELIKQTYRVLLTRGMKGCYFYFMDESTRHFVQSRIDRSSR